MLEEIYCYKMMAEKTATTKNEDTHIRLQTYHKYLIVWVASGKLLFIYSFPFNLKMIQIRNSAVASTTDAIRGKGLSWSLNC